MKTYSLFRLTTTDQKDWILTQVMRPAAPNHIAPAVLFAHQLVSAKSQALVRSYLHCHELKDVDWSFEGKFTPYLDDGESLDALHGGALEVWMTRKISDKQSVVAAPANSEEHFWEWLDDWTEGEAFVHPAVPLQVQFITEADYNLVREAMYQLYDIDWVTREEFLSWSSDATFEARKRNSIFIKCRFTIYFKI